MRKPIIIIVCVIVFISTLLIAHHIDSTGSENTPKPADDKIFISTTSTPSPSATPAPTLIPISPLPKTEDVRLDIADSIITVDVAGGFPGAVLLVEKDGKIIFLKAYGYLKLYEGMNMLQNPEIMQTDTVFDLASLSKIYATQLSVMKLYDAGYLSLDQHVYEFLPEFDKEDYEDITIRQLLTHTSGLPSDVKFFRPDVKEGEEFYSTDKDRTISLLSQVPLENTPGERYEYSDIGFMVLGAVIEKISGMPLDEFALKNIYQPLGIEGEVSFNPLSSGFDKNNIACTERLGNTRDGLVDFLGIRRYTLQGEVHDEKTYYSMGGVAGHAGLFANAEAITTLNRLLLSDGTLGGVYIFSPETVGVFTTVSEGSKYALGFSRAANIRSLRDTLPADVLNHSGWTGTFSLIDKQNNLSIVLLTNKRHSPITDGDFEGAHYSTGKYYDIVNAIYEGLGLVQ